MDKLFPSYIDLGRRPSFYDEDSMSVIASEAEVRAKVNEVVESSNSQSDQIVDLGNKKLSKTEYSTDIREVRKISNQGNFTGSWWGIEKPQYAEPGIASVVDDLVSKSQNLLNVLYYGAKGDGLTDDTSAIREAYDEAVLKKATLYFPKTESFYRITDTLEFTRGINVIMEGIVELDTDILKPIVFYGAIKDRQQRGGECVFNVRHTPHPSFSQCDWTNIESIGVVIQNVVNAEIYVTESSYQTVGVMLQADGGATSYLTLNLGNISNNKHAVYGRLLQNKTAPIKTYVTQILMFGGRFTKNSTMNVNESSYGITMVNTRDDNNFDCITGYNQIFELNKQATILPAVNVPFNLTGCIDFRFENFRAEKNQGTDLARLTRCGSITLNGQGFYDTGRRILEVETLPYDNLGKTSNVIPYYYKEVELLNADLRNSFVYEPKNYGTGVKKILIKKPLLSVDFATDMTILNYTNEILSDTQNRPILTENGFRLLGKNPSKQNIGFELYPRTHKNFKLKYSGSPRICFLCFDSSGNYLIPTNDTQYISGYNLQVVQIGANIVQISKVDSVDRMLEKEMGFFVNDSIVSKVIILFCANEVVSDESWLNSLSIVAQYNDANYRSNPYVPFMNYKHTLFPSVAEMPSVEGKVGDLFYNSQPFVNQPVYWICYRSDDVNGWRAMDVIPPSP